jgi:hypothetical protein
MIRGGFRNIKSPVLRPVLCVEASTACKEASTLLCYAWRLARSVRRPIGSVGLDLRVSASNRLRRFSNRLRRFKVSASNRLRRFSLGFLLVVNMVFYGYTWLYCGICVVFIVVVDVGLSG